MKTRMTVLIAVIAGLAAVQQNAVAEDDYKCSVGIKGWVAKDDYDGEGILFGPTLSLDLSNNLFLSAKGVFGEIDYDYGVDELKSDARDIEFVFGKSWQWIDLGIGFTYISGVIHERIHYEGYEHEFDYNGYGPLLYVATGYHFVKEWPFGWYLGGTVIPVLFELDDEDAYVTLEGGLSFFLGRWSGTLGYRFRSVDDAQGFVGSLAFSF